MQGSLRGGVAWTHGASRGREKAARACPRHVGRQVSAQRRRGEPGGGNHGGRRRPCSSELGKKKVKAGWFL